ncbi:MAG: hypothetical protein U0136_08615 [Bdellovibrionota bacterium]
MTSSDDRTEALLQFAIGLFLSSLFFVVLYFTYRSAVPVIQLENGDLHMSDFAYHVMLVRDFWFGQTHNIYSYPDQLALIQREFGEKYVHAMPVGVSPIALLVWWPFAAISRSSMELACAAWSGLSAGVFISGILKVFANRRELFSNPYGALFFVTAAATLLSHTALTAVLLGQTTMMAAGALLFLFSSCLRDQRQCSTLSLVFLALVCGLKIPYLLAAMGILLAYGKMNELGMLLCLVAAFMVSVFFVAGLDTQLAYLQTQRMYSWGQIPEYYQDSLVPSTVVTLGTALAERIDWHSARVVATCSSLMSYALLFGIALGSQGLTRDRSAQMLAALSIAIFPCLAPYAGAYEDLLLLPAIAFTLASAREGQSKLRTAIELAWPAALLLILNFNSGFVPRVVPLILALKIIPFLATSLFRQQPETVRTDG